MIPERRPVALIILDGWGIGRKDKTNAIYMGETPNVDYYESHYPYTTLRAEGEHVGLPAGNQGNSEVGHMNLGAGRVIYQMLTRIDKAVREGDFYQNRVLRETVGYCQAKNVRLHLMGLIQDQGVHAVTRHAVAILRLCQQMNFKSVLIHCFSDGRDTPPKSARQYFEELQVGMNETGIGRVATVTGRYYAMDRDNRWERVELAYNALVKGEGKRVSSWQAALEDAYQAGESDEFIKPRIIDFDGIKDGDAILYFNYRTDRARQLTHAFMDETFTYFEREKRNVYYVGFTHYYDGGNFREVFPPQDCKNILGEVLSHAGLKQLRCAETEKYAHVTFFFNDQQNEPFPGEERILVSSPKVATYDLKPEMSAYEVRDRLLENLEKNQNDVFIINFANPDMVGHTGVWEAVLKAVKTTDECAGSVIQKIISLGGVVLLTADHGNADQMFLSDGSPMTSHTTNPVPFTLIGYGKAKLRNEGRLADVAPTILDVLGIARPAEMTGESLIITETSNKKKKNSKSKIQIKKRKSGAIKKSKHIRHPKQTTKNKSVRRKSGQRKSEIKK